MAEYQPYIRFPDQSESFAVGYEAGMIYQQMKDGVSIIEQNIHAINYEIIKDICQKEGYILNIKKYSEGFDEWLFMVAIKNTNCDN